MKTQLRLARHSVLPDAHVVEVFWGTELLCTITGSDQRGVQIISKHLPTAREFHAPPRPGAPGMLEVRFADARKGGL